MAVLSAEFAQAQQLFERNGKEILGASIAVVEAAQVSMLFATGALGPVVTASVEVGLAVVHTALDEHPPRVDKTLGHLANSHYSKALRGLAQYGGEVVQHLVENRGPRNLMRALGGAGIWAYRQIDQTINSST